MANVIHLEKIRYVEKLKSLGKGYATFGNEAGAIIYYTADGDKGKYILLGVPPSLADRAKDLVKWVIKEKYLNSPILKAKVYNSYRWEKNGFKSEDYKAVASAFRKLDKDLTMKTKAWREKYNET